MRPVLGVIQTVRLRAQVRYALFRLKSAVKIVKLIPMDEARRILAQWKEDINEVEDGIHRTVLSSCLAQLEQAIKDRETGEDKIKVARKLAEVCAMAQTYHQAIRKSGTFLSSTEMRDHLKATGFMTITEFSDAVEKAAGEALKDWQKVN